MRISWPSACLFSCNISFSANCNVSKCKGYSNWLNWNIFWIFYWLWLDLHKMWVCLCMFLFWICTLPSVWFKWLNEEHSGFHWKYALLVFILLVAVSKYRHLFAQHFGFMFGIYFIFCLGSFSIWLWLMWFIQISSKINWCFAMS